MTQSLFPQSDSPANQNNAGVFLELAATVSQTVPAERLYQFKLEHNPHGNPRFWAIVDFNRRSTEKRFFIFDTEEKNVEKYYVAHGKGSDVNHDGTADNFSNVPNSKCSSLGIYRRAEPYHGKHGLSLKLDGLEPTNSKARERLVVLHTAHYVSKDFIHRNGVLGRSEGCFVLEESIYQTLINQLGNGSYIVAWKSRH